MYFYMFFVILGINIVFDVFFGICKLGFLWIFREGYYRWSCIGFNSKIKIFGGILF